MVTCLEEGCEHVLAGSGDGGPPLDHTREIYMEPKTLLQWSASRSETH